MLKRKQISPLNQKRRNSFITEGNCRTACLGWGGRPQFDFFSALFKGFPACVKTLGQRCESFFRYGDHSPAVFLLCSRTLQAYGTHLKGFTRAATKSISFFKSFPETFWFLAVLYVLRIILQLKSDHIKEKKRKRDKHRLPM